jgi:hypothetical protein
VGLFDKDKPKVDPVVLADRGGPDPLVPLRDLLPKGWRVEITYNSLYMKPQEWGGVKTAVDRVMQFVARFPKEGP